jgi:hypothetical protein
MTIRAILDLRRVLPPGDYLGKPYSAKSADDDFLIPNALQRIRGDR